MKDNELPDVLHIWQKLYEAVDAVDNIYFTLARTGNAGLPEDIIDKINKIDFMELHNAKSSIKEYIVANGRGAELEKLENNIVRNDRNEVVSWNWGKE